MIFKSIETYGFCSEVTHPFLIDNLNIEPSIKNYNAAEPFKSITILRVKNDIQTIKSILNDKIPLLIGFVLYTDLFKIVNKIWMPDFNNDKRVGGCTSLLVGYSDETEVFYLKMAFGENFGDSGYITIPYNYIINEDLTPEIYYIDLQKNRIEGFLNQRNEVVSLQKKKKEMGMNSIFN